MLVGRRACLSKCGSLVINGRNCFSFLVDSHKISGLRKKVFVCFIVNTISYALSLRLSFALLINMKNSVASSVVSPVAAWSFLSG